MLTQTTDRDMTGLFLNQSYSIGVASYGGEWWLWPLNFVQILCFGFSLFNPQGFQNSRSYGETGRRPQSKRVSTYTISSLKKNFFGPLLHLWGLKFPDQGSHPCRLKWKGGMITTGSPGKSPSSVNISFLITALQNSYQLFGSFTVFLYNSRAFLVVATNSGNHI